MGIANVFPGEGESALDPGVGSFDDGMTAAGKFLLVGVTGVPNSAPGAPHTDPPMTSYLRLGTASPSAATPTPYVPGVVVPTGDDLAWLVEKFTDDARDRGAGTGRANDALPPPQSGANGAAFPTGSDGTTKDARAAESAQLHSRGGWRDHTDGNRISTTRGDKVEIIRGNYKLLVLGRQDPQSSAAASANASPDGLDSFASGVELSGGELDTDSGDLAAGFATNISYTWERNSDGRFGWTQSTTVGNPGADGFGNGKIVNQTWVDEIFQMTGSTDRRVHSITQGTYASSLTQTTDVELANVAITTGLSYNTFEELGFWTDVALVGAMANVKAVGAMGEYDEALIAIALAQIAPLIPSLFAGIVIDVHDIEHTDTHLGSHTDTHAGLHTETHVGLHTDTHSGMHLDTHAGVHMDVHSGPHYDLAAQHAEVHSDHFSVRATGTALSDAEVRAIAGTHATVAILQTQS